MHTPDVIGPTAKPSADQRVVVEVQARSGSGVVEAPGRLTLEQFKDLAAEIIRIGERATPKSNDQ